MVVWILFSIIMNLIESAFGFYNSKFISVSCDPRLDNDQLNCKEQRQVAAQRYLWLSLLLIMNSLNILFIFYYQGRMESRLKRLKTKNSTNQISNETQAIKDLLSYSRSNTTPLPMRTNPSNFNSNSVNDKDDDDFDISEQQSNKKYS